MSNWTPQGGISGHRTKYFSKLPLGNSEKCFVFGISFYPFIIKCSQKWHFNNQRGEDRTENFVHINTCILIIPITTHISPGLTKMLGVGRGGGGGGRGRECVKLQKWVNERPVSLSHCLTKLHHINALTKWVLLLLCILIFCYSKQIFHLHLVLEMAVLLASTPLLFYLHNY